MKSGIPNVTTRNPVRLTADVSSNDRNGPDLVPADHARPSRTTRRKMSSIGASVGSKRSMRAPAATSAASSADGSAPFASMTRETVSDSRTIEAAVRHGGQRAAGVDPDLGQRVSPPDFVDGAVDHQLPLVDERHAIAERLDLIHMVRREDRRAAVPAAFDQQVLHEANVDRIETGRRLVEDAELGVGEQGAGYLHLLRHALAQAIDLPGRDVRQFDALQPLERRAAERRRASSPLSAPKYVSTSITRSLV